MKVVERERYVCPACSNRSSTLLRFHQGSMVPFCECGAIKDTVMIPEVETEIDLIQTQPNPEVHAFRKEYNEFLVSPETQEKLNSGQYSASYTDAAASTRKD